MQDSRNGKEFELPETMPEHRPIEKGTRGSPVSVNKRMVVGEPEMKNDGTNDGRNENMSSLWVVGERAERFETCVEFVGGGRLMMNRTFGIHDIHRRGS